MIGLKLCSKIIIINEKTVSVSRWERIEGPHGGHSIIRRPRTGED